MDTSKKISVIMGVYNCEDTLAESIESIISQTYDNWELIMCDDCSTDGTFELAKKYQNSFPNKVVLLRNTENMSLAYSLNRCLEIATGEYIARMDGDDKCVPDRFEKQIDFLKGHPDVDLCGTAMQRFDDNGELGMIDYRPQFPDKNTMKTDTPFNHATIVTHKYVYDRLNGYVVNKYARRAEDRELWYRFFANGFIGQNISEPLYWVRENISAIKRRTVKDRYYGYINNIRGYRLLHFPISAYINLTIRTLIKIIVPTSLAMKYRKIQAKKQNKEKSKNST